MTFLDEVCTKHAEYGPVGGFLILILEYLFGKTIYGSVIGFAINLVKRPFTKGVSMLEGKEVDVKFDGGAGEAYLDADDKGGLEIGMTYTKDLGLAQIESANKIKTNIFKCAEKVAASTGATWDDAAVKSLEALLGIK